MSVAIAKTKLKGAQWSHFCYRVLRFINFVDNSQLDADGFAPFGEVVAGMDVVDRIFQIGDTPQQFQIQRNGR